ncbi:(2Fe-2S)-binding protein [Halobacteriales archaeon QS_1_68_20]|nr:MAG: (2Fe-2S)-binding protein [Halobacteriales archaeon QS_1_68_20]
MDGDRITMVDRVRAESTFLFTVEEAETGDHREAILIRLNGEIAGWLNYCQHLTHIKLDKGSGAPVRDGEIICTNHGAMFEQDSGLCTFGPCEGAYLDGVEVAVEDGDVYLVDDDYSFVSEGPMDDDDDDLTSTSNVEF